MMRLAALIVALWSCSAGCAAQSEADTLAAPPLRPVNSVYTFEAGSSHITDTYLSPIRYSGWHLGFNYERLQAMKFSPDNWVMQMKFGLSVERDLNKVNSTPMWYGEIAYSWGMMRRWKPAQGFSVGAGGVALLNVGCIYLDRGGNNPASAKASITVGATGYAAWHGRLGRLPVTLRYQPTMSLLGAFFAPDYGELYYEIYLGNHSGLVHCAWPFNHFDFDHVLSADLHFGTTSLRIGYRGGIYSTEVNHTVTNMFTHAAVIGISGEWISIDSRKPLSDKARIISATY